MTNKKNIIIGIAAVIVIAAMVFFASGNKAKAQATVAGPTLTWSGVMDASMQNYETGTETLTRAGDGNLNSSRLRVAGSSPDLGGIKFNFGLEGGLRASSGTLGSTTTVGQAFTREAFVGVSGAAGEIRVGLTDLSAAEGMDTIAHTFVNFTNFATNRAGIEIGTDTSNAIRYISPNLLGFQLQAGYAGNGNGVTTDAKSDTVSGSVVYTQAPLRVGAGYSSKKATTSVGETDAKSVGVSYTLPFATVGAAYIYGDNSTTADVKSTSSIYSVRIPLEGGVNLHGVYAMTKDGAQTSENKGTGYTLGVTKNFTDKATIYGAYSTVTNETNSTMSMNGMTVPSAGKDPNLFVVGVSYSF